jgi:hypothetical protein
MSKKRYRKKPVVIEAVQWTGDNIDELFKLEDFKLNYTLVNGILGVYSLEGVMWASVGDYIIKGVRGEFYPCKPDIFKETYEEVTDE